MFDSILEFVQVHVLSLQHAPFKAAVLIFWVIGHFMSTSVFTRKRAYTKGRYQPIFWWGRESLELHPILAGLFLGFLWTDPEGSGLNTVSSMMYFAAAGACSLFMWTVVGAILKRNNLEGIKFPGESDRPPPK